MIYAGSGILNFVGGQTKRCPKNSLKKLFACLRNKLLIDLFMISSHDSNKLSGP